MTSLGDGVTFHGDLVVTTQSADVGDGGYDVAGEFALDGEVEVLSVGCAEAGVVLADVECTELLEVDGIAGLREGCGELVGVGLPV